VRFSLGEGTHEADVDRILDVTPDVVGRLRSLDAPAMRKGA
jgi:cysteine sulfinate desulfinase/cysteine desulfurase-like protein